MKLGTWSQFGINLGLTAFTTLLASGKLSPEQKSLALGIVQQVQQFLATFNK